MCPASRGSPEGHGAVHHGLVEARSWPAERPTRRSAGAAVLLAGQQALSPTVQPLRAVYVTLKAMPPMEPSSRPSGVTVAFQTMGTRSRWTGAPVDLQPLLARLTIAIRIASAAAARESGRAGAMGGFAAASVRAAARSARYARATSDPPRSAPKKRTTSGSVRGRTSPANSGTWLNAADRAARSL